MTRTLSRFLRTLLQLVAAGGAEPLGILGQGADHPGRCPRPQVPADVVIVRPDWTPEQAEAMWRGIDRAMNGPPAVPAPERCWKDVGGQECGEPATTGVGLCTLHLAVMQEAPVMPIPAPPSMPAQTGCGRR